MKRMSFDHVAVVKRRDGIMGQREAIEAALDSAAEDLAKSAGLTKEVAYAQLLDTDAGRGAAETLYEAETGRHRSRPVRKAAIDSLAKCAPLEGRLDAMAQAEASRTGDSFEKGYARALQSAEGRTLYAQICALQEEAHRR
jgi:hypothetical protein